MLSVLSRKGRENKVIKDTIEYGRALWQQTQELTDIKMIPTDQWGNISFENFSTFSPIPLI